MPPPRATFYALRDARCQGTTLKQTGISVNGDGPWAWGIGDGVSGMGNRRWAMGDGRWLMCIGIVMVMGMGPSLVFIAQSGVQLAGICMLFGGLAGEHGVLTAFAE